jgi:hypothetical protein
LVFGPWSGDARRHNDLGPGTEDNRPRTVVIWACLPLLAGLYLPFIGGGLLTDDFAHVVRLSGIESAARLIDQPDTFGFYRPVTQASMILAPGVRGERPGRARALNIALHACVIAAAFIVARLSLQSAIAGGLATLMFALTPKAAPIAVLWISARGELLMALFSLTSIAAWMVWTRHGRGWWLVAALVSYALALLSKETATLLPLLLLVTPRSERTASARFAAAAGFIAVALGIYAWRSQTGALTPFAGDEHYSATISLTLWARNAINYLERMIVAPAILLTLVSVMQFRFFRRAKPLADGAKNPLAFAVALVVVFLAPVVSIPLRSELYLYLPVFGVCLLTGWLAAWLSSDGHRLQRRALIVALTLYTLALGGYQIARAREMQRSLSFSEKLVAALQRDAQLVDPQARVLLLPSDLATERLLQNAVGDYLYLVLQHAFPGTPRSGAVQYSGVPPPAGDVRLQCAYRQSDGAVVISPAP